MYDKYKLSDQMHQFVLNRIKNSIFTGISSVLHPEIFILGGQPGAGKSVLTRKIQQTFDNQNIVTINSDEFRLSHPQAQEIFNNHDKDFSAFTDPDTRLWGSEVFDAAIKGHYNIIFEGTMRTTQICNTIKNLLQKGYKVHIMAMAVPEIKSRISIYSRYQEQLDRYPIARFTSRFSHDAAYHGMLDTLKLIEKEHLFHTVTICNRKGDVLFKNGDTDIVAAINQERNKPLSLKDSLNLLQECDTLLEKMRRRGEKLEYIEDLSSLRLILSENYSEKDFASSVQNLQYKVHELKSPAATNKLPTESKQSVGNTTLKKIIFQK